MLLVVIVVVVLAALNVLVTHRIRLIGTALLLVPQIFVPGLLPSIVLLWSVMTCVLGLAARGRSRADSAILVTLALFTSVTALSLLWALPSGLYFGLATVVYGIVFTLWLRETIVLGRDDPKLLDTIVLWCTPGVVLQSALVVIFRLSPAIESRFLHSNFAAATVGPPAMALFADEPNNVLDPARAGGFFVNSNVAALFGGVSALLICVSARRSRRWALYFVAIAALIGVVFTGSKTGLMVGVGCAFVVAFLPQMLRRSGSVFIVPIALLAPLGWILLSDALGRFAPSFYSASGNSYDTRQELWGRAAEMFQQSPLLGVGFGGWVENVGRIGSRSTLPPHNFLVAAWAYSGVVAVALAIAFLVVTIGFGFRVAMRQREIRDRRTAVITLCAVGWVFLHGMGDNTAIYGDRQTMILFAVAIGYLYAMSSSPAGKSLEPDGADSRLPAAHVPRTT